MNEPVPDELASYEPELAEVERRVERRVDPGHAAVAVAIGAFILGIAYVLTWTGTARGWEILVGEQDFGVLPRLFAITALGFGLVGSMLALATRWWALAWLCALGCGFSVIDGIWAIWSRQVAVPIGGSGPGAGLVLGVLAVLVLAVCWARIALRRG